MKNSIFLVYFLLVIPNLFSCNKKMIKSEMNCGIGADSISAKTNMNGVSFENVNFSINTNHVTPIKNVSATWVTTMPFGYIVNGDDSVQYNSAFQYVGETTLGVIDIVNLCHDQNLKVMIKPHLWAMGGVWIGDVEYSTESEWQTFENSYLTYIVDFARIADSLSVEAFCIGVEMKKVVVNRPQFWFTLIDTVRSIYKGPITYASNWDNYNNVGFWSSLDFIGIDAYFPVSDQQTPTVASCFAGWETDFNSIKNLSESLNKKVIFTEFGYRNVDYTGLEPWDESSQSTYNSAAQINAYQALFNRFWGQTWFEGGFLWKWHPNHSASGGENNNRFTPQNKAVEAVINEVYQKSNG
ncbi:MAG: glycoside hydrolase [Crocinitomicaceae bacterium]